MPTIPLDDEEPNADGTFTVHRPGIYTLHGLPIAEVKINVNGADVVTLRTARELPKDEPIGNPEKWRTMNRAARREAKRHRK